MARTYKLLRLNYCIGSYTIAKLLRPKLYYCKTIASELYYCSRKMLLYHTQAILLHHFCKLLRPKIYYCKTIAKLLRRNFYMRAVSG